MTNKVVPASFSHRELGNMTNEIMAVINTYANRITVAEVLGVLDIVKHYYLTDLDDEL